MKEVKMGMRRMEVRFLEEERGYADDLGLCGKSEDLKVMVGCFAVVCRR